MSRIVYVNGRYVPYAQAAVHAEDRGFQFADAVYEVCEVRGRPSGRRDAPHGAADALARRAAHRRSRCARRRLAHVMREIIRRNRVRDGLVYLQVSRGAAPARVPVSPTPACTPTVVCLARSISPARARGQRRDRHRRQDDARHPLGALRHQDGDAAAGRARQGGRAQGRAPRRPGSSTRTGFVTEGASSNAWIVDKPARSSRGRSDADILPRRHPRDAARRC